MLNRIFLSLFAAVSLFAGVSAADIQIKNDYEAISFSFPDNLLDEQVVGVQPADEAFTCKFEKGGSNLRASFWILDASDGPSEHEVECGKFFTTTSGLEALHLNESVEAFHFNEGNAYTCQNWEHHVFYVFTENSCVKISINASATYVKLAGGQKKVEKMAFDLVNSMSVSPAEL